jgi:hypothetical protein
MKEQQKKRVDTKALSENWKVDDYEEGEEESVKHRLNRRKLLFLTINRQSLLLGDLQ